MSHGKMVQSHTACVDLLVVFKEFIFCILQCGLNVDAHFFEIQFHCGVIQCQQFLCIRTSDN